MNRKPVLVGLLLGAVTAVPAATVEFARIQNLDPNELYTVGFELPEDVKVVVDAVGIRPPHWDDLVAYAWILDTDTREPVWEMKRRGTDRVRGSRVLRKAEDEVSLAKGKYELYMWTGIPYLSWSGIGSKTLRDIFSGLVGDDDDEKDYEREVEHCYVALSSDDVEAGDVRQFEVTGGFDDALLRFNRVGNSQLIRQGIELTHSMSVRIYALIEYPKGDRAPADYAWIARADDREVVWKAERGNSARAGGNSKNRVVDEEVPLEAGRYLFCYGTDDSHAFDEFNVNPPYDPVNWGMTILPGSDFDRGAFKTFEAAKRGDQLLAHTRAEDSDFFEQPFRLAKGGDLHVYSIGEYSYGDHEFVDYAWIVDTKSGDTAWEMTARNTMGAGGAEKNRMFDGEVRLEGGDYVLYYVTDDSHSYEDWNSAAPFEPEAWGVQVFATDTIRPSDLKTLTPSDVEPGGDALVRIVRVGDGERIRERFTLDREARIHIYALGEGVRGEMYDYPYIMDDETGHIVWEMKYEQTRHAGGAKKNRLFDGEIKLPSGKYEVIYTSDDSHSFEGWNDARPRDPMNWGVTVRRAR